MKNEPHRESPGAVYSPIHGQTEDGHVRPSKTKARRDSKVVAALVGPVWGVECLSHGTILPESNAGPGRNALSIVLRRISSIEI